MTPEAAYCTTCTGEMPAESPLGLCPSCLITKTLDPAVAPDTPSAGPYQLLEKIGEGSYGEVFIGEQTDPIQREAAVKLLKIDHLDGPAAQRFQAEAQALALLDHPNIARLYEAGVTSEDRPYLALELVPGLSLTAWCDSQDLDIPARVAIFHKVCAAMHHAHQRGLIHRDLKPENILVDPESAEPKVIDFGIARSTTTLLHDSAMLTGAHDIIGTPAFLSPEQTDGGNAELDTRTDVYSLGAVLYVLLTGKNALEASGTPDSHYELLKAIRETTPPRADKLNPNIPTNITTAISKAMAKSPDARFASAAELSAALDTTTAAPSTGKPSRKTLIAAVTLMLAGLAALLLIKPPARDTPEIPPAIENSFINSFKAPLKFVESGYHKPPDGVERIAPFAPDSVFAWFTYEDATEKEFNFAFDSRHATSSSGEFIVGAKGADLPGARHVTPGSPEDQALCDLINGEKTEAELEKIDSVPWEDIRGSEKVADKTFADKVFELRKRRSLRRERDTWPVK